MIVGLRRHASTLVLLALVAGTGAALYLERGSVTTTEATERRKNLLPAFRGDEVSEIRLTTAGRSARVFRGEPDDAGQRPWKIEIDGATGPADEMAVDQLLGSLREGVADRKQLGALSADERRDFGLDGRGGPEISLAMGAQRYRVRFGGPASRPPGAVWAEVEGHWAAVITGQLAAALQVSPDTLRQKALVTWEASDLDALDLDGAGGPRHLVRAPWRVARGLGFRFDGSTPEGKVRVSGAALDRIWEALGQMKADAFLADADADKALVPTVTVALSPHGGKKVTVIVGGECPGHPDDVVAVRGEEGAARVSACVPRGVVETLSLPASDLADRRLVGARADEVIDVQLQQGATTLSVARTGTQWHEQSPIDRPVEPEVGRGFLERIADVQATDLAAGGDAKALGLDPPRATVRVASVLGDGKDDRIERLEVGAEQAGMVHVRRLEDGVVATVSAAAAAALLPDELTLRARKVLDFSPLDVHSVRVTGPLGTQRFERAGGGPWSLIEPRGEGLSADAGLLSELCEAVATLSADRWIGAARPEHGLDHPRLTLVVELGAGKTARTVEVTLGAPSGVGSFARLGGDPAVFVAPHKLEAAADRWILDRTALLPDVERMTRVTLAAEGGKQLVLEQTAGALHAVSGPTDPASAARAAQIRDALADLVAEGAVSVGPPLPAQGLDKPALLVTVEQGSRRLALRFGAGDAFHGTSVYYARREGFAATFAVAQSRVRPLIEALR
jgi:hypothetical protein